jgi:hypothetical protein
MKIHPPSKCKDRRIGCPFHGPTDHHMVTWPIQIRASGLVERICEHGVGHPDPDSVEYFAGLLLPDEGRWWTVHGCDGCCRPVSDPTAP